jgi:hypothetical protein
MILLATCVPSELNSNAVSIFERCTHIEAHRARQAILPTRRSLPLVSKAFYTLANRHLYKSILISRGDTLRKLIPTLQGASYQNPGQWVKRLDVCRDRPRFWTDVEATELSQILPHMPNLEIFVGYGGVKVAKDCLTTVIPTCTKLKIFFLPGSLYRQAKLDLGQLPVLSSLRGYFPRHLATYLFRDTNGVLVSPGTAQELRAIAVPNSMETGADFGPEYFPNLCTLHMYGTETISIDFLKSHGHKITTLDVELSGWTTITQYLRFLPNVRNVIIDLQSLYMSPHFGTSKIPNMANHEMPNRKVTRVGLTVNATQAPHRCFSAAFDVIPQIFPDLKRLCILERCVVERLSKQPSRVTLWHSRLIAKGIRLEREDGELLCAMITDTQYAI